MDRKHSLVIYERREVIALTLLALVLVLFAFTWGLHLGKLNPTAAPVATSHTAPVAEKNHAPVKTVQDEIPNRQELTEQGRAVPQASDEALDEALHEEVGQAKAHLTTPRQVELPKDTKRPGSGKTQISGKYTLQVGSYPTEEEAQKIASQFWAHQLESQVRAADVQGVGKRFRVLVGGFPTKRQAEHIADGYKTKGWIESYIVVVNE